MTQAGRTPPLVVHVIDRLVVGGMENGIVNLINNAPRERYRHAIVCLRYYSDFRDRIVHDDVEVFALDKRPGKDVRPYLGLWRLLRRLRSAIVHTRNLPTVDLVPVAVAAGVRGRVHGEHGRDVLEIDGTNVKYNLFRRAMSPWVQRYITVSRDLQGWLGTTVGIPGGKIRQIYNGVDLARFQPAPRGRPALPAESGAPADSPVIGTVGRMERVKDQLTLVRAFIRLCAMRPADGPFPFLALVGDGSLREPADALLREAGLRDRAWLAGSRDDVPELMRAMDVFVLPSINEGISNTVIEAMATGLPVIAAAVGGNPELVEDGSSGSLVGAQDPDAMAEILCGYLDEPARRTAHGAAGRARALNNFAMPAMVESYLSVYDEVLAATRSPARRTVPGDRARSPGAHAAPPGRHP